LTVHRKNRSDWHGLWSLGLMPLFVLDPCVSAGSRLICGLGGPRGVVAHVLGGGQQLVHGRHHLLGFGELLVGGQMGSMCDTCDLVGGTEQGFGGLHQLFYQGIQFVHELVEVPYQI